MTPMNNVRVNRLMLIMKVEVKYILPRLTIDCLKKKNSVNCVRESTHKIMIGLQYELITIASNYYPDLQATNQVGGVLIN